MISFIAAFALVGVDGLAPFASDLASFDRAERAIDRIELLSESFVGERSDGFVVCWEFVEVAVEFELATRSVKSAGLALTDTDDEDAEVGDRSSGVVSLCSSSSF